MVKKEKKISYFFLGEKRVFTTPLTRNTLSTNIPLTSLTSGLRIPGDLEKTPKSASFCYDTPGPKAGGAHIRKVNVRDVSGNVSGVIKTQNRLFSLGKL